MGDITSVSKAGSLMVARFDDGTQQTLYPVSSRMWIGGKSNLPPIASFTHSVNGLTVSVNGSGSTDPDGTIELFTWGFGDGTVKTGSTTSHTYSTEGSYRVQLIVTDNRGATNDTDKTIAVATIPEPDPDPEPTPGDWVHPLPGATLTSPYGPRDFDGFHWGTDWSTGFGSVGDPVLAPTDIRITVSADGHPNDFHFGTAGNHVKGHTLDGAYTFNFMHLSSRNCSVGDIVPKGVAVGVEGATGNVSGLHLHFEAYIGQHDNPGTPPYGDPVDPVPILRANGAPV